MNTHEIQAKINLFQKVMDASLVDYDYGMKEALEGKDPPPGYLRRIELTEKAGLTVSFWGNAEPLYDRAKAARDKYRRWLHDQRGKEFPLNLEYFGGI